MGNYWLENQVLHLERCEYTVYGSDTNLLVGLHDTECGERPRAHCRHHFSISKVHILQHMCCIQVTSASQLTVGNCGEGGGEGTELGYGGDGD